jgi:peptidoglycan/LPS O-acetylase OafA/YrhL
MRTNTMVLPPVTHPGSATPSTRERGPYRLHRLGAWLAGAAALFFTIPFLGTDVAGLEPDLYYLVYFTLAVAWFGAFACLHRVELAPLWRHRLGASLGVGAAAGAGVAFMILDQSGTSHPDGPRFGLEVAWRGVVYGSVDAITLFVFPAAVAYLIMRGDRSTRRRKVGFAALALALSYLVTVTYHLGYAEYRDDTMRYPLIGATVAAVPTVVTGNPVGAVVTHATMHVAAASHQYQGGPAHMLPPRVTAGYPSRGDDDLAAGLAAGWMLAAAGTLSVLVRRRAPAIPSHGPERR